MKKYKVFQKYASISDWRNKISLKRPVPLGTYQGDNIADAISNAARENNCKSGLLSAKRVED
jgi:DNA/RNA-binding domain of Phe-tRNA-synthetase-like protein